MEARSYLDAFTHWSTPNVAAAGFNELALQSSGMIRSSGALIYAEAIEAPVREFRCDVCPWVTRLTEVDDSGYPQSPANNDVVISQPSCTGALRFVLGVTDDVIYKCVQTWYDSSGTVLPIPTNVYPGEVSLGHDSKLLTGTKIIDIRDGSSVPIVGLPSPEFIAARVASADSFWVVPRPEIVPSDMENPDPERWTVTLDGVATLDGTYPPEPGGVDTLPYPQSELDGDGNLFQFARSESGDFSDSIVRRNFGGTSEIVYDEATNPLVKIHGSDLVTGP